MVQPPRVDLLRLGTLQSQQVEKLLLRDDGDTHLPSLQELSGARPGHPEFHHELGSSLNPLPGPSLLYPPATPLHVRVELCEATLAMPVVTLNQQFVAHVTQRVWPMALQPGSRSRHRSSRHVPTKEAQTRLRRAQGLAGDRSLSRTAALGRTTLG